MGIVFLKYLRRSFCVALVSTILAGCGSSAPPGTGVVLDRDKKPVTGVHVLVWRVYTPAQSWWGFLNFVGAHSSPSKCDTQHYELTDAQGRFTIPANVIERPWGNTRFSYMQIVAFKPGFYGAGFDANIAPTGTGSDGEKDYFPTKEKPLEATVTLDPEIAFRDSGNEWGLYGCSCSPYHKALKTYYSTRDPSKDFPELAKIRARSLVLPAKNKCD